MRVRLLIENPQDATSPPFEPNVVMEGKNGIVIGNYQRALPVPTDSLETVTLEQIRRAFRLRPDEQPFMHLAAIREVPDAIEKLEWAEWLPTWLGWLRNWWLDEVTDLARRGWIEAPPAILAAV